MDFLKFDAAKCTLCGKCIDKCPFGALSIEAKGIAVGDACRMCGMCVRSCPEGAIRFEQRANTVDKSKWRDFLVYVEQERGDIHPVAFELIGEARKMARKVGYKVNCVLVGGEGTTENAKKLLPYGVDTVYVYEHPGFEGFRADCCADAVADCIAANKTISVLIGATALGRSLAPRLSTRFHTGLTADCTTLDIEPSTDMVQIRPAFGGNIIATIVNPDHRPQMATVREGVMRKEYAAQPGAGEVKAIDWKKMVTDADLAVKIIDRQIEERKIDIKGAGIIVAGGYGMGSKENFRLVHELADVLGGEVGASRAAVDAGFTEHARQVGQTGVTVRPKLYIACGISGQIQHTAGMDQSSMVISINSDPEAPINKIADYAITGDVNEIIPKMIKYYKQNSK